MLEQELRCAFEATILDIPRSILLNFPQLLGGLATIVVVTEMTLAAARDTIRVLSWLKSNAPHSRVLIVANKVHPTGAEISDADFTAAIERPVDFSIAFDHKAAVQAARLGQTLAEANRTNKIVAPIRRLSQEILDPQSAKGKESDAAASTNSLLAKFDFKSLLGKSKNASKKSSRAA